MYPRVASLCAVLLLCVLVGEIHGHGMVLDPPGRSSRWRYDSTAPVNYDDNALYCGGFATQWYTNDGNCGLCGDDYALTAPRPNELGGYYGAGVIVRNYTNVYTATFGSQITANHLGYIYYEICDLDKYGAESEECFAENLLSFADGNDKYFVDTYIGYIESEVVLPAGLSCEHCVLRWTYRAGNNWGWCDDGTGTLGCGAQEHFKACADISIQAPST